MEKKSIDKIKNYYESFVKGGKTRFEIWEEGKNIGVSMTPSIAYEEYRKKLVKLLNELLDHSRGNRILSCGCGNAFIEKLLLDSGHDVLVTDICESALKFAGEKGLKAKILDANKFFNLKENFFDLVFSDGLIGHLLDENLSVAHFIKESKKVLKEEGLIFIGNESASNNEDLEFVSRADFYFTSAKYLESALKKEGFEEIKFLLFPYKRPNKGIRHRVWIWGLKPKRRILD